MRFRSLVFVCAVIFTSNLWAKDVYLSIAGTVGAFRTDLRIVNPSTSKDITVQAYLLPAGNAAAIPDNAGVQPKAITIGKRQMAIYNDVVTSLFNTSGLAAIRLTSDDDFIATERIYATAAAGTLGQFVVPVEASSAKAKGIITQLAASSAYRTNLGVVNPNNTAAHVKFTLYDKNNAIVATGDTKTIPPYGATSPLAINSGFFFNAGTADLSDAWVSWNSDIPVIGWGSVVDNGTTDQIFVPPFEDTGVTQSTPPPQTKEFDVTLNSFSITMTPDMTGLKTGDKVTLHIHNEASGVSHGFQLNGPDGRPVVNGRQYSKGEGRVDQTFTVGANGTYIYFCTNTLCGFGHADMSGIISVGNDQPDDGGGKY
jgi:hypothetical protein